MLFFYFKKLEKVGIYYLAFNVQVLFSGGFSGPSKYATKDKIKRMFGNVARTRIPILNRVLIASD